MPTYGGVKLNIHGFFSEDALPNRNHSGIGVIIRNYKGKIVRMYYGSLGIGDQRINELYAMHQGLARAYLDEREVVELETDNVGAYWEWTNSMNNGVPVEHEFITR